MTTIVTFASRVRSVRATPNDDSIHDDLDFQESPVRPCPEDKMGMTFHLDDFPRYQGRSWARDDDRRGGVIDTSCLVVMDTWMDRIG